MRSGEHDLWDAFMETGRARSDLRQLSTRFAIMAEQARRNLQQLAATIARNLERTLR